jgi:hypothetical protein
MLCSRASCCSARIMRDQAAPRRPVGRPASEAIRVEGPVIEVAVTPNRSDCFGVLGIARELAAAGLGELTSRDFNPVPGVFASPLQITLAFPADDEAACPLFVGRAFRSVTNRPSPPWLQERLAAVGLRPISTLVDITNLVTMDLGRPLHVFDAAKLRGDIVLRFARPGERLLALDGNTYELDPAVTVIADRSGVISLGGIMGGAGTGCTEATTDVVSRSPCSIRARGQRTPAWHRETRAPGSSAASTRPWSCRAWNTPQLILELCGEAARRRGWIAAGAATAVHLSARHSSGWPGSPWSRRSWKAICARSASALRGRASRPGA